MDDALTARLVQGVEVMTAFLTRQPGTGVLDQTLLRATLGNNVTDDDVIAALVNTVLVSELMMFHHERVTGETPLDVLRLVAATIQKHAGE